MPAMCYICLPLESWLKFTCFVRHVGEFDEMLRFSGAAIDFFLFWRLYSIELALFG